MAKRRTLQQLFDLAIDSGKYREVGHFMCTAMNRLFHKGQITADERLRARLSIKKHLNKHDAATMWTSLADKGILNRDELYGSSELWASLTTEIYRNWSRRDALPYWQARAMQLKLEHGFIEAKGVE